MNVNEVVGEDAKALLLETQRLAQKITRIFSLRLKNELEECGRGEELLSESWECILKSGVSNRPN
jgi:hypothetical protein